LLSDLYLTSAAHLVTVGVLVSDLFVMITVHCVPYRCLHYCYYCHYQLVLLYFFRSGIHRGIPKWKWRSCLVFLQALWLQVHWSKCKTDAHEGPTTSFPV